MTDIVFPVSGIFPQAGKVSSIPENILMVVTQESLSELFCFFFEWCQENILMVRRGLPV
jgi:hypothetical protein